MGVDPISIGIMAAGTLMSIGGGIMGQQAQKKAMQAQQRQADLEAQNQKLQQIRQARIARANIIQAGENQGAGGSSSVTGGASGTLANAEQNIQYIGDQEHLSNVVASAKNQMADAEGIQKLGGSLQNIGGTVFNHSDYITSKAKSIFG